MAEDARNPESILNRQFREAMELLDDGSRVLEIARKLTEDPELENGDLEWLLETASQKGYARTRKPPGRFDLDFNYPNGCENEGEAMAAYYVLEFLEDYYYRLSSTGKSFRLALCKYCERPYRQTRRNRSFCSDSHRALNQRKPR